MPGTRAFGKAARPIVWILGAFALATALPFVILTSAIVYRLVTDAYDNATATLDRAAQASAADTRAFVGQVRQKVGQMAQVYELARLDATDCGPVVSNMLRFNPDFANAFTVDASGRVICSALPTADPERLQPAEMEGALASPDFHISDPVKEFATHRMVVYAMQPMRRGGEVVGFAVLSLDLVSLSRLLNPPALADGSSGTITTRGGRVVTRWPEPEKWVGRDISSTPAGLFSLAEDTSVVKGIGMSGMERLWAVQPIRGTDWVALAGMSTEDILEAPRRKAAWIIGSSAAITAMVLMFSIVLARRIARPIETIAGDARRMAIDEGARISPSGPAELVALGEELNRMIDSRMQMERQMRESERQLRLVTDHFPGLVARFAPDGRYTFANEGYRRLLDRDPEAMRGLRPQDFLNDAELETVRPHLKAAFAGRVAKYDSELTAPDGTLRRFTVTMVPDRVVDGSGPGISLFAADVTERIAVERQLEGERAVLQGIIDSALSGIITLDQRMRIVIFNPAAEKMFGVSSASMIGQPLDRLLPVAARASHEAAIAEFGRGSVTARRMGSGFLKGLRASGEEFPTETAISHATVGGEKMYTAIVRDVTERVRAEDEVRRLNRDLERLVQERTAELEAANRELEAFDYSISHDLRAPLARIHGFGSAVIERHGTALDAEGRRFLDRIVATAADMDELVQAFMALALVSRGDFRRAPVDVSKIAEGVVARLRQSDPGRTVETSIAPGLRADGDARLVCILLENLISNAWKFTSQRSRGRIDVGVAVHEGRRAFFVSDNGVGFDPKTAERMFEPFRRFHSNDDFPGTGIGLATVSRIARRHGGTAWAEGRPGEGATFYFVLWP